MKTLQEIIARLAAIETEIREASDVEKVNALAEEKRGLLEKKQELEALEQRRTAALGISLGSIPGNTLESRDEENPEMNPVEVRSTKEYRSAFLKTMQGLPLNAAEKRAYNTTTGASAIPTVTADVFFGKMVAVAPMLNEITLLRVAGNVKFSTEGVRDAAAKHTENEEVAAAGDTMLSVELGGYEYIKIISISKTQQAMSIDMFEEWLAEMLSEDLAVAAENAIFNGDGDGDPKGIEYANTWVAGTNSIEFTNGGNPTYDNVMDLISKLPLRYHANAKFYTTTQFLYGYLAKIKDDQKQPILVKDMEGGFGFRIMGFPVKLSDKVAAKTMYFCDAKKVVGNMPLGPEIATDEHFRSASIDHRGIMTFDCDIALADAFVKMTEASA